MTIEVRTTPATRPPRPPMTFGRFTTTSPSEAVFCGVCCESYKDPAAKAEHLRNKHRATVVVVEDEHSGLLMYEWRVRHE